VTKPDACCVQHIHGKQADTWELIGPDRQPLPEAQSFLRKLSLRALSPRSIRTYAYDLLCAYRWMHHSRLRPQQIHGEQLVEFIAFQQQQPPAAHSTINRRVRLLERLVTFLTGKPPVLAPWQIVQALGPYRRSLRSALYLPQPRRLIEALSDGEVIDFLSSLNTWRDRAIVLLMWAAGLRCCEILRLQLHDVQLDSMSLRLRGKGNKERTMPLAESIVKPLLHYLHIERPSSDSLACFLSLKGPHRGRPMTYSGLRRLFRYHRLRANVPKANPHRFRHTFGANMTRARVPLPVLSRMMGHALARTTMRYIQLADPELRQEYDRAIRSLSSNGVLDEPNS
jgi:site-specific recombinase XerD